MTIKIKDPEVPRALPRARLYLDDIEQIVHVLTAAERKASYPGTEALEPPTPTFQVGNQSTTEIEDLRKIAKRTSNFTLKLERPGPELLFQIDGRGAQWWSSGLARADAWETFHKLEAIIRPKASRLETERGAIALGTLIPAMAAFAFLATRLSPKHADTAAAIALLAVYGAGILFGDRLLAGSSVILRYSYDEATRREERNSKILIALLGAALGLVSGVILTILKGKYWP